MTGIKKIIQCIIREIEDVNKPPYLEKFNDAPNNIPGLILTGDGGSLFVNRTIETNITKVADCYSNQQPELKEKCTTKEWRAAIRATVGRSYKKINPNDSLEQRGLHFKQLIESEIDEYFSRHGVYFLSFGCSLFRNPLDSEFTIGPVTFFPVQIWLNKALNDQLINNTEHQRLTVVLLGENPDSAKDSLERSTERPIYEMLNGSQLVCTVNTEQLYPKVVRGVKSRGYLVVKLLCLNPVFELYTFYHFAKLPESSQPAPVVLRTQTQLEHHAQHPLSA